MVPGLYKAGTQLLHSTDHDPFYFSEPAGISKVAEHMIEDPGFNIYILYQQDLVPCVNFIRCATGWHRLNEGCPC